MQILADLNHPRRALAVDLQILVAVAQAEEWHLGEGGQVLVRVDAGFEGGVGVCGGEAGRDELGGGFDGAEVAAVGDCRDEVFGGVAVAHFACSLLEGLGWWC